MFLATCKFATQLLPHYALFFLFGAALVYLYKSLRVALGEPHHFVIPKMATVFVSYMAVLIGSFRLPDWISLYMVEG